MFLLMIVRKMKREKEKGKGKEMACVVRLDLGEMKARDLLQ